MDEVDLKILRIMQMDCRTPLEEIAKKIGVSKSTVHYRLKKLENEGIIQGYYAKINPEKMEKEYLTATFVRAKYGPGYHNKIGKKLAQMDGVWAVYYIFGEYDFLVLTRSNSREDYLKKLEEFMGMKEIERTNTQVVAKIIKEDPRLDI